MITDTELDEMESLCGAYIGGDEDDWLSAWLRAGPRLIDEVKRLRAEGVAAAIGLVKRNNALETEVERLRAELDQERVRLAGCSVAALGCATGDNDCKQGDYGWSASFDDVKRLYARNQLLEDEIERLRAEVSHHTKLVEWCMYLESAETGQEVEDDNPCRDLLEQNKLLEDVARAAEAVVRHDAGDGGSRLILEADLVRLDLTLARLREEGK